MITRLVKMTFHPEKTSEFLKVFESVKDQIAAFDGCEQLQLWKDVSNPEVYFTYSVWQNEQQLDHYRFSELFKDTWKKVKILFKEKAEAHSLSIFTEVK